MAMDSTIMGSEKRQRREARATFAGILALAVSGLAFATGCASESRAFAPSKGDMSVSAAPPPPVAVMPDGYRGAPAESQAPAPANRPGLGTEWGEERESRIEDVAFVRDNELQPIATTELRYDDERGVGRLATHMAERGHRGHESIAAGGAITIWLKDGHDNPLDVVQVSGHTFVIGEAGERYTIVLENHTGHRFETVSTVDGLDVISGKPGTVRSRGYLLMPYATLEIDGFRQSTETVAAFRFGRVADSYAAAVGSARDVGVIGVAFFGERGDRWSRGSPSSDHEVDLRATANPFPGDGRFAPPPPRR